VTLTGETPKGKQTFTADVDFAARTTEHPFVARLWAQRQVGLMLDEIRQKGEQPGLVAEVTQLATRFGIVTPYTSYLVVEEGAVMQPRPDGPGDRPLPPPRPMPVIRGGFDDEASSDGWAPATGGSAPAASAPAPERRRAVEEKAAKARDSLKAEGGKEGVGASREIGRLKDSTTTSKKAVTTVQQAMGRAFTFKDGAFVDSAVTGKEKTLAVQPYSDAWFKVLALRPDLKEALALGEAVKVLVAPGKVLIVVGTAPATVAEGELKAFLAK
jgi:Ca-activated chloride channel family protein